MNPVPVADPPVGDVARAESPEAPADLADDSPLAGDSESATENAELAAAPSPGDDPPLGDDPFWDDDETFDSEIDPSDYDPLEPGNRAIFGFNQLVDGVFWTPLTKGYRFIFPDPVRKSVRRAFKNLNSPAILVNDLLQGRPLDAGKTLGRFVINSTLGVGGLFDAASQAGEGWHAHTSDFGQTLALAGVDSGPYMMIPMFGPNTVRDSVGGLVDLAMQPLVHILLPVQLIMVGGTYGLAVREEHAVALEALKESSIDYYAAMRSVYFQNRRNEIWGDDPPPGAH